MQTRSVADKASLSDLRRSLRHDLAAAGVADATTFDCLIAVTEAWNRASAEPVSAGQAASVTWDITPTEARIYVEAGRSRDACKSFHPSRTESREAFRVAVVAFRAQEQKEVRAPTS